MNTDNGQTMAWNDPDKNNNNSWGNKSNSNSGIPPELSEFIKKFKNIFNGLFGGGSNKNNGGTFSRGLALLIFLVIVWALSGIYIVDPAERGVVLRFGSYIETTMAGPHWHWPTPIETVELVDVDSTRDITVGYRNNLLRDSGDILSESLMLTKDENIINAKFAVQYKIKNAKNYLFNVVGPKLTLRQVTESAVREVVGKNDMDFIITEGRAAIVLSAEKLIQRTMDNYKSGIIVTQVTMKDAQPPDQVQAAFADVVKAQEDNKKYINQAESYRNEILPRARGKAARILAEANAYKEQIVAKAEGESSRFKQILTEYSKAPDVTRKRMHLETMQGILSKTGKIIVDAKSNSLLMLPVDKLLAAGAINAAPINNSPTTNQTNDSRGRSSNNTRGSR